MKNLTNLTIGGGKKALLLFVMLLSCGWIWGQELTATIVFSEQGYTNAQVVNNGTINSVLSFEATKGTNDPAYYTTGTGLRVYNGGSFIIKPVGVTITSISIQFSGTGYTFSSTDTSNPLVWTGSSEEDVTFPVSRTCRIQQVTVTYVEVSSKILAPVLSSVSGTKFLDINTVTATSATEGVTIYYTIDGTIPDTDSQIFPEEGLTISETTTINAIAVKDDVSSPVATATYTKIDAYTIAEAKALASGTSDIAIKLDNAVVTGVGTSDVYVQDATGAIDLYRSGQTYEVGDVLNGYVIGTYTLYSSLPEVTSGDYTNVAVTKGGTATPAIVTLAELAANPTDYYCSLVKVEDVTYSADDTNSYLNQGETQVVFYDKLGALADTYVWPSLATVTGIVIPFSGAPEIIIRTAEDIENTSGLQVPVLSWSAEAYTADKDASSNEYPTFTTNSDGAVTYTSSNPEVATIAEDGTITLIAAGTTTITALLAASDTYSAASVSYTLTVVSWDWAAWSALVAERDGIYYAMSSANETGASRLDALVVNAVNGKVIKENWAKEITWYADPVAGTIKSMDGRYVTYSSATSTSISLSSGVCKWTWDATTGFWHCSTATTSRSLALYSDNTYFRLYDAATTYRGATTMSFSDGYVREINASDDAPKYGTICLPCAVSAADFSGAEFYTVLGKVMEGETVTAVALSEPVTELQAGVPYIYYSAAAKIVAAYTGEAVTTATTANGLVGSLERTDVAEGNYIISGNQVQLCGTGCYVEANRAYLDFAQMSEYTPEAGVNVRLLSFDNNATAVNEVKAVADANVDVYTLSGVCVRRQVNANEATVGLPKGVYVINAKKVIVK